LALALKVKSLALALRLKSLLTTLCEGHVGELIAEITDKLFMVFIGLSKTATKTRQQGARLTQKQLPKIQM